MNLDLIDRARRPALAATAVAGVALGIAGAWSLAAGVVVGAGWNLANLLLLRALARAWGREARPQALRLLLLKLGVLYPVGLALLLSPALSAVGILAGFTGVFLLLLGVAVWPARPPLEPRHG